jgi:hypothetical protein
MPVQDRPPSGERGSDLQESKTVDLPYDQRLRAATAAVRMVSATLDSQ